MQFWLKLNNIKPIELSAAEKTKTIKVIDNKNKLSELTDIIKV